MPTSREYYPHFKNEKIETWKLKTIGVISRKRRDIFSFPSDRPILPHTHLKYSALIWTKPLSDKKFFLRYFLLTPYISLLSLYFILPSPISFLFHFYLQSKIKSIILIYSVPLYFLFFWSTWHFGVIFIKKTCFILLKYNKDL